uniref:Uncharacterized protein n=1 Tax=Arundo donax TaxID=35708 RepID=A0A0A8ZGD0_ARUDO
MGLGSGPSAHYAWPDNRPCPIKSTPSPHRCGGWLRRRPPASLYCTSHLGQRRLSQKRN